MTSFRKSQLATFATSFTLRRTKFIPSKMFLLQTRRAATKQPVSVSASRGDGVHFPTGCSAFSQSSRTRVATKRETGFDHSPSALALRSDARDPEAPVSRIIYDAGRSLPYTNQGTPSATAARSAQPNRVVYHVGPQQKASKTNGKQFESKSKPPPEQPFGRGKSQPQPRWKPQQS